ncbi:TetR/AcrR family transcriptional regulator [Mycolicibacterium thermoresistibile]
MTTNSTSVDKAAGAGRPRDPRIDGAILRATADLLVEIGYANLTMAAIAERAGTTKTALYRRWSSKAELVYAAAAPTEPTVEVESSDDVATIIRAMVERNRQLTTAPMAGAAMPGLLADMAADPRLHRRLLDRVESLVHALRRRLAEAAERGEVHADVDADRLIELIGGAAMLRMVLHPDEPMTEKWADDIAAILVRGVVRSR